MADVDLSLIAPSGSELSLASSIWDAGAFRVMDGTSGLGLPVQLAARLRAALPERRLTATWRGRRLDLSYAHAFGRERIRALREGGIQVWAALVVRELDVEADEAEELACELIDQVSRREPPLFVDFDDATVRVNVAAHRHPPRLAALAEGRVVDWARAVAYPVPRRIPKRDATRLAEAIVLAAERARRDDDDLATT